MAPMPHDAPTSPRPLPAGPTPLWAVNLFSFLNSFGTGVITNGIYFVTKNTYDFSPTTNYFLGVVIGVTYVLATLLTAPAINALRRRGIPLTGRRTLLIVMAVLAAACSLPVVGQFTSAPAPGSPPSSWPIWVMVILYIPMTGVLWPIIEAYISGGRRGDDLRRSMGTWNFIWSGATAVAFLAQAPLIEHNAPLMILLLGGIHILAAAVLLRFTPEAASHEDGDHEPHPPVYEKLLVTFRILLPTSYILHTALQPFLPTAMAQLGVHVAWQPVLNSVFAFARSITFFTAGRIHTWHGRWSTPIISGILLFSGFALALFSPLAATTGISWIGIFMLAAGLTVFAAGMALNYTAAIYYAMAVGNAQVDAGGKHEALIGVGYTVGPLCGLIPAWAIQAGALKETAFEPFVLSAVGIIGLLAAASVLHRVWKHA